jgi:hypothetical protein
MEDFYSTVILKSTAMSVAPPALVISPLATFKAFLLGLCRKLIRSTPDAAVVVLKIDCSPRGLPLLSKLLGCQGSAALRERLEKRGQRGELCQCKQIRGLLLGKTTQ